MDHPFTRIGTLAKGLLRRPAPPQVEPTSRQLSAIGNLVPPLPRRRPAPWATDQGYVLAARRLLTVMGAKVGGANTIAATMARALGASTDPAATLQRLRDEAKQVERALGELRKVQGQLAEEAGEVDGIEPLATVHHRARQARESAS